MADDTNKTSAGEIVITESARGYHVRLPHKPSHQAISGFHGIINLDGVRMKWERTINGTYWFIPAGQVHPLSRAPKGSACVMEAKEMIAFWYPDFTVRIEQAGIAIGRTA
jgi:hypothetical protein